MHLNYIFKNPENQGTSPGTMGKHVLGKSESRKNRNSGNLRCPFLNFGNSEFLDLKDHQKWWNLENHEKSKTRNLLTLILPVEFLQKLGYEFHFDQKTWNENVVNRTDLSIFGQCNPYHQPTYRFPPLHPISAPDACSMQISQTRSGMISFLWGFDKMQKTWASPDESRICLKEYGQFVHNLVSAWVLGNVYKSSLKICLIRVDGWYLWKINFSNFSYS